MAKSSKKSVDVIFHKKFTILENGKEVSFEKGVNKIKPESVKRWLKRGCTLASDDKPAQEQQADESTDQAPVQGEGDQQPGSDESGEGEQDPKKN